MMNRMKLHHQNVYDAPAAEVYAMLIDPAFRRKIAAATDAVSCDAAFGGGNRDDRVVGREHQPAARPPFRGAPEPTAAGNATPSSR